MQDTDGLAVTFDDVIDAEADPGLLMIVQGLDDAYRARPVPDDVHLRVERALSGSPRRGRRGPRLLTLFQARKAGLRNLKIATASAALLLLVTGAGFGATSVLQKVYDMNAGTHQILTQNLGKEVNETRVAGGFSVELKRAYADSNKIVLGVTLSAPPQRHINSMVLFGTYDFADRMRLNTPPVLSDDHGQRFPGGLAPMGTGVQDGASGTLLEYAPTGLQPGQPLLLHLHASAIEVTEDLPSTAAANAHEPRCDEVQGTLCDFTVRGNFSFDFSVPVDPGLVLSLNQASTVNHVALTLVRVTTGIQRHDALDPRRWSQCTCDAVSQR
jgi:hypothetical protein